MASDTANCSCTGKRSSKYETESGKMWNGEGSLTKSNFLLITGSVSQLARAIEKSSLNIKGTGVLCCQLESQQKQSKVIIFKMCN